MRSQKPCTKLNLLRRPTKYDDSTSLSSCANLFTQFFYGKQTALAKQGCCYPTERSVIFYCTAPNPVASWVWKWCVCGLEQRHRLVASLQFPSPRQRTFTVNWTGVPKCGRTMNKNIWYICRLIRNIIFCLSFHLSFVDVYALIHTRPALLCAVSDITEYSCYYFPIWGYTHKCDCKMGIWLNLQTNDFKLVGMFMLARCASQQLSE